MVQLEVFAGIVGIAALLAVFVPLTFDSADITGGFQNVTKALCNIDVIFLANSTLVECDQPNDTFEFIAGTGMIITANETTDTIIFNSTGGGTVILTQICPAGEFFDAFFGGNSTFRCTPETTGGADVFINNTGVGIEIFKNKTSDTFFFKTLLGVGGITITNGTNEVIINGTSLQNPTHVSLGGDADVFKLENATHVEFRGISEDFPINVTARTLDVLIDLDDAIINGTLIVWNSTLNEWEFQTPDEFISGSGFDNTEFFYPHLCVGEASDPIQPFTNYKTRAVEYDKPKDCNWQFVVPENIGVIGDLQIKYFWYVDKNTTATVCMQTSFLSLDEDEDIDGVFTTQKEFCHGISMDIDILQEDIVTWTPAEHTISVGDMVFVKIEREDIFNGTDTYPDPAWLIGAEVRWVS